MTPMDAAALSALEAQLRALGAALTRLVRARADLVPARATFWSGPARAGYDRALVCVDEELGATIGVLRLAEQNTRLAIAEVERRG